MKFLNSLRLPVDLYDSQRQCIWFGMVWFCLHVICTMRENILQSINACQHGVTCTRVVHLWERMETSITCWVKTERFSIENLEIFNPTQLGSLLHIPLTDLQLAACVARLASFCVGDFCVRTGGVCEVWRFDTTAH